MNEILKNSFVIGFIISVINKFYEYYENSVFYKITRKIKRAYRFSQTKKQTKRYIRKDPYFKYSITYRIIDSISDFLSVLAERLNKRFAYIFDGSEILSGIRRAPATNIKLVFIYSGYFISASLFIYLLCCVCFLTVDSINIYVSATLVVLVPVCLFIGNTFEYIKYSTIYRFIKYWKH